MESPVITTLDEYSAAAMRTSGGDTLTALQDPRVEEIRQRERNVDLGNEDIQYLISAFDRLNKLIRLVYPGFGMAGESGETVDKLKKLLRDAGGRVAPEARMALLKELGDQLWYINDLTVRLGSTLREVAQLNIDKLTDRFNRNVVRGSGDER